MQPKSINGKTLMALSVGLKASKIKIYLILFDIKYFYPTITMEFIKMLKLC